MVSQRVHEVLPEWEAFVRAVQARRPDSGTWCEAWTARDVLIHQAGNAEELARVLAGRLAGNPVETRGFEREDPYRRLSDAELWAAFTARCEELTEVAQTAATDLPADTEIEWTGRTVKVPFFAEHMREELILHRWDLTGDDSTARDALSHSWMTEHSVREVGKPLLRLGASLLGLGPDERIEGRLRSPGTDDIVVAADRTGVHIGFDAPTGPATIESDPATRNLLLWGRRPADPSRWHSDAGPGELNRVRNLLVGYRPELLGSPK